MSFMVSRVHMFEESARIAEARYAKNPLDAEVSEYAIKKLEEALSIDNFQHLHYLAFSYLGSAYLSIAFLGDLNDAIDLHDKAIQYYRQACDLKPERVGYKQYLKEAKVELQAEKIKKQSLAQQATASGPSSTSTKPAVSKEEQK